ncbi:MAG: hypothetical protein ACRD1T_00775 [Acidimicrobiia bacterium]
MAQPDRMKQRDLLLAIISICGKRPEFGRTSLQKVAYFASEGLHVDLGHRAHLYGPFSDTVESDIEMLIVSGLVDERAHTLGFIGPGGYEGRRFEYSLTPDGEERIESVRAAHSTEFKQLEAFVDALTDAAGGLDQRILSPAAKTYFIAKREKRALSLREIGELALQLGWRLTPAQVKRVSNMLQSLGLLKSV